MSKSTRDWMRMFAQDHRPGSYRVRCPDCNGGRSGERTMNVTIESGAGIMWKCHRASCPGKGGSIGVTKLRNIPLQWAGPRVSAVKPYWGESYMPSADDVHYFGARFGIDAPLVEAWVRRTVPTGEQVGAYLFPIFDLYGRVRGHVVRQPLWKGLPLPPLTPVEGEPKARTWPNSPSPTQSWYFPDGSQDEDTIVIVEDQVSAMACASAGFTGLALLGTHLNIDRVREIQRHGARRCLLALDNDAEGIALQLAQKWGMAIPGFELKLLHDDLKDVPDVWEEING